MSVTYFFNGIESTGIHEDCLRPDWGWERPVVMAYVSWMGNQETPVMALLGHVWTPEPCTGSSHSGLLELDDLKWAQKGVPEGWLCGHMT